MIIKQMVLSKDEQLKIIHSIPESKLNELASHLAMTKGSGKMKGSGWWGDAWGWLKKNVTPVLGDVGKTLLKEILLPVIKAKIKEKLGGGLGLAGTGKKKIKASGLKLSGQGKAKPAHMIKGSEAARLHMAKLRSMRKKK
jgi:hypothetical protein